MKYTFDRTIRMLVTTVVVVVLALLFKRLSGVLLPFLIGWVVAYLLHPLVCFVQMKMRVKNRVLSVVLTLIFVAVVLGGLIWALVPAITEEVSKATVLIHDYLSEPNHSHWGVEFGERLDKVIAALSEASFFSSEAFKDALQKLIPGVMNVISGAWSVVSSIFVLFTVFLYTVFILIDYEKISIGFREMIPTKYKKLILGIVNDVESGMNKYFRGQSLVALIVGVLFAIGFRIVGLPMGITVGLFIGVLNLVPYLQTIGIVPVTLLALIQSAETGTNFWFVIGGCAIVFVIVQATQDMFLVPRIMGKAMGLNPAVILLALSIWGSLLGLAGMIVALPFTTIIISYYKRFVLQGERIVSTTDDTPDSEPDNVEQLTDEQ